MRLDVLPSGSFGDVAGIFGGVSLSLSVSPSPSVKTAARQ